MPSFESGRTFQFEVVRLGTETANAIIFLHGLYTSRTRSSRKSFKSYIRDVAESPSISTTSVYAFGFNMVRLLEKGRPRILKLCKYLTKEVEVLEHTNLFFIGHGTANWIIQAFLGSYRAETSLRTSGVVFLGKPQFNKESDWIDYAAKVTQYFSNDAKPLTGIELPYLKMIEDDFQNSIKHYAIPMEDIKMPLLTSSSTALRSQSSFGRTFRRIGSGMSSSSNSSVRDVDWNQLYLPIIHHGDEMDKQLSSALIARLMPSSLPKPMVPENDYCSSPAASLSERNSPISEPLSPISAAQRTQKGPSNTRRPQLPLSRVFFGSGSGLDSDNGQHIPELEPTNAQSSVTSQPASVDTETKDFAPGAIDPQPLSLDSMVIDRRLPELHDLSALARSYHQSGELQQARRIYEDLINEVKKRDVDTWTIAAQSEMALILLQQGYFRKAEDQYRGLEKLAHENFPKYHDKPWEISRWLGVSLDKQGLYFDAHEKLTKLLAQIDGAIKTMEDVQNADLSQYLPGAEMASISTKNALALVLAHLEDFEEAIKLNDKAIGEIDDRLNEIKSSTDNKESLERKKSRFQANKALILGLSGDYEKAEALNKKALETMEELLGIRCVATLECWTVQAKLLAMRGNTDEAEMECHKVLKEMRAVLGKEHPSTLQAHEVLVSVYTCQARFTEARNAAKYLVDMNTKVLGKYHPQTLSIIHDLTIVYLARGEGSEALLLQDTVAPQVSQVLGENHPATLGYRSDLARIYCHLCDWVKAKNIAREVFLNQCIVFFNRLKTPVPDWPQKLPRRNSPQPTTTIDDKTLGRFLQHLRSQNLSLNKAHPSLWSTMYYLGIIEREGEQGNLALSLDLLTDAMENRAAKLGKEHPDTQLARLQLSITQRRFGHLEAARRNAEIVLGHRQKQMGEIHPDYLSAKHELSLIEALSGRLPDAIIDQREILRLRKLLLGEKHPDTVSSRFQLAMMLEDLHLQTLGLELHLTDLRATDHLTLLESSVRDQLMESILGRLRNEEVSKTETINGATPRSEARLSPTAISSMKTLVSAFIDQEQFVKATKMLSLLMYHQELDHGAAGSTTLENLNNLAWIYQVHGRKLLSDLESGEVTLDVKTQSTLLLQYYDSQSNLAFLFSNTGDMKAAHGVQKEMLGILLKYEMPDNELTAQITARCWLDLAWAEKELGLTDQAFSTLKAAIKFANALGSYPSLNKLSVEMHEIQQTWRKAERPHQDLRNSADLEKKRKGKELGIR